MAETSGFFRSVSGDRKYTTDWLAKWVASFIGNGVYNGELAVTAGDGMTVTLPAGKAWINGYYYRNDAPIVLPVANADGVLHRKDTIVLRWDVNERNITAQVLKGTFGSSPIAPVIVRDAEQYDLKIAEISIPAGTTAITQALITDTRLDTAVCGIVTGVVHQVDTTTFYNQIAADLAQFKSTQQADFEVWFDSIKDILDDSTAGNLLNMINAVSADLTQHKADTTAHITTAERTAWNNKANGNNAVWVATETISDGASPNSLWHLTIPNFIFTEGCQVTFKPQTTPTGSSWDKIVINNVDYGYALRTLSKTAIEPDSWGENATVTVNLSLVRIPIVADSDAVSGTAFFKGSSIAKDTKTVKSAMTLSTAEPSSFIGAGKFWGVY